MTAVVDCHVRRETTTAYVSEDRIKALLKVAFADTRGTRQGSLRRGLREALTPVLAGCCPSFEQVSCVDAVQYSTAIEDACACAPAEARAALLDRVWDAIVPVVNAVCPSEAYLEVQAALLNSECDPQRAIEDAVFAVAGFAESECGVDAAAFRAIVEAALTRLAEAPRI